MNDYRESIQVLDDFPQNWRSTLGKSCGTIEPAIGKPTDIVGVYTRQILIHSLPAQSSLHGLGTPSPQPPSFLEPGLASLAP